MKNEPIYKNKTWSPFKNSSSSTNASLNPESWLRVQGGWMDKKEEKKVFFSSPFSSLIVEQLELLRPQQILVWYFSYAINVEDSFW